MFVLYNSSFIGRQAPVLISFIRRVIGAILFSGLVAFPLSVNAQQPVNVDISEQSLASALHAFGRQSGLQIAVSENLVEGLDAPAVKGSLSPDVALAQLLDGSGLTYVFANENTVVVKAIAPVENDNRSVKEKSPEDTIFEEITVTATRRATSLQDTAMSITAISGEDVKRKALEGFEDYARLTPGVSYIDRTLGANSVIIRGIASDPQSEIFSSGSGNSVGVYLDEVPVSGFGVLGGTSDLRLADMKRVEILRGPQGTVYGASSLAGTVRNITVEPNLSTVEGGIVAGYSNTARFGGNNNKLEGVFNIPLIEDKLAIRAVAYRHDTSGYIKNIARSHPTYAIVPDLFGAADNVIDQDDIGQTTYTGGRLSVLWVPNDNARVKLQYIRQEAEQFGSATVFPGVGDYLQTVQTFGEAARQVADMELTGVQPEYFATDGVHDEVEIINAVAQYDFGWGTLLSSSSWIDSISARGEDESGYVGGFPAARFDISVFDAFIEELRFTSDLDGPAQYMLGAYYENIEGQTAGPIFLTGDTSFSPYGTPFGPGNPLLEDQGYNPIQKQKALFGELSYAFTEQLELTVGGRWFDYTRSRFTYTVGAISGTDTSYVTKSEESDTIYKVNLSYKPGEETHLYLQWAQGFRLGNAQFRVPPICDVDNDGILDGTTAPISDSYSSDNVDNYELGGKMDFLDSRLRVNAALYRIDWSGLPIRLLSPTCFNGQFVNAGEARSEGFELQTEYYITDAVKLNMSGSYTHAELTADAPGLGVDGDRLPGSPKYNIGLGLQYEFDVAGYGSYVRSDYTYIGGYYNNLQETGIEAGDFGQLNLSAGIQFNVVSLQFFARNLTNENAYTWAESLIPDGRAYQLRPRTIGMTVGYQF